MAWNRLALAVQKAAFSSDLKEVYQVFNSEHTSAVIYGFWFARVVMVLKEVISSMHLLM